MEKISAHGNLQRNDQLLCPMIWLFALPMLFGPLVGCYFLSKNFQVLDCKKYARNSWLFAGAIMILLVLMVSFPMTLKIFKHYHSAIAAGYAGAIYSTAITYQREKYKKLLEMGYKKYPVWKILTMTLLWTLITIILTSILIGISALFIYLFHGDPSKILLGVF